MVGEDDRDLMRAVARYLESVNGLTQWERAERNPGRFTKPLAHLRAFA